MNLEKVSDDTAFTIPDHVLFREAGDESVLLNLQSEEYFGLDGVGNVVWSLMTAGAAFGAIIAEVAAAYEVDPGVLEADLRSLVAELADHGLIAVRD